MTHRIPLDHLTSDQYDALCNELAALRAVARGYCPACGRGDAAPTVADWEQQRQRADQAEATIGRIQDAAVLHRQGLLRTTELYAVIEAALDQPAPAAATQATDPAPQADNQPVQCWHTDPDSPCDWDICRQPERLAAGDYGTDPREPRHA